MSHHGVCEGDSKHSMGTARSVVHRGGVGCSATVA